MGIWQPATPVVAIVEAEFVNWLQHRLAPSQLVPVGIGDDAAVLAAPHGASLVVATDMLMDGAHFVLSECGPHRAGRKALGVNLSDLAAMASTPLAAFVSLALPRQNAFDLGREILEGMFPLAEECGCEVAGGDTNVWGGPLVVNVAVIGTVGPRGVLTRSGARPGDWILLTGACGGSRLGRHLDVAPRVHEALRLHERYELHAAIDVSDGLALDLSRVATASGCGACIDLDDVPIHPDAQRLAEREASGSSSLEHALGDGEDFELILAASPSEAQRIIDDKPLPIRVTKIGEFVAERGLWSVKASGERNPLPPTGFEHK